MYVAIYPSIYGIKKFQEQVGYGEGPFPSYVVVAKIRGDGELKKSKGRM